MPLKHICIRPRSNKHTLHHTMYEKSRIIHTHTDSAFLHIYTIHYNGTISNTKTYHSLCEHSH